MRKAAFFLIFAFVSSLGCFFCNDSGTNNSSSCDSLTIKYPAGGEEFKVGTTYQIEWCVPANATYTQTKVSLGVFTNGFGSYKDLKGASALPVSQLSFAWTIDSTQIGDSCKIRVSDYDQNKRVTSGFFKITR
jgi:hypothetical protein